MGTEHKGLLTICSVYDAKTAAFHNPMYFQTRGQAWRSFADAVNQPDSDFNRHPEDYCLEQIGTFNPHTGELHSCTPQLITTATDVKEQL